MKDGQPAPLDLVCLGNLTIDDVVLPDKTTHLGCFGGDAIYAALGASLWSDQVRVVAPVGNDYPQRNLDELSSHQFETGGMPRREVPGIRNWVIYQDDNTRTWILESNPEDFFELSPTIQDIPGDYLDSRGYMVLAMDLAAQEALAPQLRRHGIVAIDPQEDYILGNESRILEMLRNADIFMPSLEEVDRLLGHRQAEKACRLFAERGVGIVAVKLGSAGSLLYERATDRFWRIPAYRTRVVDTTGAGDSYCGGFMAMYIKTGDLLKAGIAGSVSASFTVEDFGLTHLFSLNREEGHRRFEILASEIQAS